VQKVRTGFANRIGTVRGPRSASWRARQEEIAIGCYKKIVRVFWEPIGLMGKRNAPMGCDDVGRKNNEPRWG